MWQYSQSSSFSVIHKPLMVTFNGNKLETVKGSISLKVILSLSYTLDHNWSESFSLSISFSNLSNTKKSTLPTFMHYGYIQVEMTVCALCHVRIVQIVKTFSQIWQIKQIFSDVLVNTFLFLKFQLWMKSIHLTFCQKVWYQFNWMKPDRLCTFNSFKINCLP